MMNALDVVLDDEVTVIEIRLVTELMMVAAHTRGRLEQDVIDVTLGVERVGRAFPRQRRAG